MPRSHPMIVATLLLTGSCRNLVDPSAPGRTPLIEAMLLAGTPTTEVRVRWLDSGQAEPTAAQANGVALTLRDEAGRSVLLRPAPAPGGFTANLAVVPGHTYRLSGTVGNVTVAASTTVPFRFTVTAPAGDTLRLSPDGTTTNGPFATLPFQWGSDGATVFAVESAFVIPTATFTSARAGQLLVFGRHLRLLAMNRDLAGYLYRSPAETNFSGAFGVLGAAIEIRKEIVWQ